jgi:hypothetical protein
MNWVTFLTYLAYFGSVVVVAIMVIILGGAVVAVAASARKEVGRDEVKKRRNIGNDLLQIKGRGFGAHRLGCGRR